MMKDLGWHSLQERRAMSLSYKIVHGLVDEDPSEVGNSGRATRRSTSQHRFRNITANKNCYRVFLFSVDCSWVAQPARPSRSAHSVETFRANLAQEIGIAALISRNHYYYDWDDCWPPVPYIPYGSFAQNRFIFRSQHLSTESGDNSRRPRLGQKRRVKPAVVWLIITLFYRRKITFSFWMTIKTKSI